MGDMRRRAFVVVLVAASVALPPAVAKASAAPADSSGRLFGLQYSSSVTVVRDDGSVVHRFAGVTVSALSPDGSRLAVERADGLHVVGVAGDDDVRVDPGPWTDLAWNRSGLYGENVVELGSDSFPGPLTRIDPNGSSARVVLGAHSIGVSPDGRFTLDYSVAGEGVGVADVSGHNAQLLAHVGHVDFAGGWSPDGTRLGVNVDSAAKILTVATGSVAATGFDGSTDTTPLAFTADGQETYLAPLWIDRDDDGNEFPAGLDVADANGNNPRTLVNDTSLLSFSAGGGQQFTPDPVAPGAVSDVTAAVRPESEVLQWTAPADLDFAGVDVRYARGSRAPTTPADGIPGGSAFTRATLVGLAADTTYSAALFPRDWSGNTGAPTTITFTTEHQRVVSVMHPGGMFMPYLGSRSPAIVRYTHADHTPIPGLPVRVIRQYNDHPARTIATLTTNARGEVAWRQRWTQPTTVTFTTTASATNTASSIEVNALVQPRFTVTRPRVVRIGHPFTVTISGPPGTGITVDFGRFRDIQPRSDDYLGELGIGSYEMSDQPTLDRAGHATERFTVDPGQPRGRWEIQIRQSSFYAPPDYDFISGPEPFQKFAVTVT